MSTSSGEEWSSGTSGLADPSDSTPLPASDPAFAETGRDEAATDERAETGREETFDFTEAGLEELADAADLTDLADLAERADSGRDSSAMSPAPLAGRGTGDTTTSASSSSDP